MSEFLKTEKTQTITLSDDDGNLVPIKIANLPEELRKEFEVLDKLAQDVALSAYEYKRNSLAYSTLKAQLTSLVSQHHNKSKPSKEEDK